VEFLRVAPAVPVSTTVQRFPMSMANKALEILRSGSLQGAAVLTPF
jgi:propanol-preferring alcohol dehydrogenase